MQVLNLVYLTPVSPEGFPTTATNVPPIIVTTSTTTQPQNGDEDEYSNVLLRHVAHQDDDTV